MSRAYLITGISGFVAGHYLEHLSKYKPHVKIIGVDERPPVLDFLSDNFRKNIKLKCFSLLDTRKIGELIRRANPDYIIHLASYSSVALSWTAPVPCYVNNTNIFLNIAETVRKLNMKPTILSVGSCEEYGDIGAIKKTVTEECVLNPASPYAVARVSQEMISRLYSHGYGIPVICTRSFNSIGSRQRDIFAVSSFARQIIEAKNGKLNKIVCGDISVTRDFIDVRDAVYAYDLLLDKGAPGEVYNVCSGKGYKLIEIISMLQELAGTDLPLEKDPALFRHLESPIIVGSCDKLRKTVGFKPRYGIKESLVSILNYWETQANRRHAKFTCRVGKKKKE